MDRWCGRAALVTGASSGIGRAITINLLTNGMNVFACARRVELVQSIADEIKDKSSGELIPLHCDVRKETDITAMFEKIKSSKYGGIDVCVNNAGVSLPACPVSLGKTEDWRSVVDTNLLAVAICTREALASMKSRGVNDGHIIQISSVAGHYAVPGIAIYSAAKHGVRALTECVRQELLMEKSTIRVTMISNEMTETALADRTFAECPEFWFKGRPRLFSIDIASAIEYALSTPKHVQVHDMIIYPVDMPSN